jgi:hypothetical protein
VDQHADKPSGIYDTLLKTSRSIAAEQDKVLALMVAARTEAAANMLPFQSGTALLATSNAVCSDLEVVQRNLTNAITRYLTTKAAAEDAAKSAQEALNATQDKVGQARRDITRWNAVLAILEKSVAELPAVAQPQAHADTQEAGLATFQKRIQSATDTEVRYVDGDGKTQKRRIQDILKDQVTTNDGKIRLSIPDAPGATLKILMLGVDLARVEKQRAETHLLQLSSRLQLYERVNAGIRLARALHTDAGGDCAAKDKPSANFIIDSDKSMAVEAALLARQGHAAAANSAGGTHQNDAEQIKWINTANRRLLELAGKLIRLRQLAVAQSISSRAKMDLYVNESRLAHEEAILDSQVNDVAWRTVMRSGVVVLDQYEQGGFSAQDAGRILNVAQTVALGVIAGRIQ